MSFGSQLLALRIDEQLQGIFVRYIAQFQSNNALYQPEYETIIAILYYALSLATRRPTPGMQTLKLQLNSHEQHKPQWLFLWLILVYMNKRGNIIALTDEWKYQPPTSTKYKMWKLLNLFTKFRKILECGNMVLFFVEGIYPCILHRLAHYSMVSSQYSIVDNHVHHNNLVNKAQLFVKFRQLLWLLVIASVATCSVTYNFDGTQSIVRAIFSNIHNATSTCKQLISHYICKMKVSLFGQVSTIPATSNNTEAIAAVPSRSNENNLRCNICYSHTPNIPYVSPCNHTFCYLCISAEMEDIQSGIYTCPVCHRVIHEVKRYESTVIPGENNIDE